MTITHLKKVKIRLDFMNKQYYCLNFKWDFYYKINFYNHSSLRTIMAVPTIDGIDWDNFRYHPVYGAQHHRGIFEWGFLYKESVVPERELNRRKHNSEPYK